MWVVFCPKFQNSINKLQKFAVFLSEVVDSLARGFEDKLMCDNLILEINSSRYAYNVTVREVNSLLLATFIKCFLMFSCFSIKGKLQCCKGYFKFAISTVRWASIFALIALLADVFYAHSYKLHT